METSKNTQPFDHKAATRMQDVRIEQFLDPQFPRDEVSDLAADKPVLELCNHYEQLTSTEFSGYDGKSGYCGVHTPAALTIDLGEITPDEERDLGLIQLLLFDPIEDKNHGREGAQRRYHYRVLVAEDFATAQTDKDCWEWKLIFDSQRTGWCRNWQFIHLKEGLKGIRYIRIHCMAGLKNNAFHMVRLRAYTHKVASAIDFEALRRYVQEEAIVPTPSGEKIAIDPSRSMCYYAVDPTRTEIELGDGFPLSKRIYDTMNFIQLIADRESELAHNIIAGAQQQGRRGSHKQGITVEEPGMTFAIDRRYLDGINTTIAKKVEAFQDPTDPNLVQLDWRNIYQILASIADDIAIVERDPKNMERVVLDPVNAQLDKGNREDTTAFWWSLIAMGLPYLLGLLIHLFK
ncbi:MAG: hypothetical protein IKZ12_03010 [Alistipes sp.]|nr:hypothetical protein [Alistipes sp.]